MRTTHIPIHTHAHTRTHRVQTNPNSASQKCATCARVPGSPASATAPLTLDGSDEGEVSFVVDQILVPVRAVLGDDGS